MRINYTLASIALLALISGCGKPVPTGPPVKVTKPGGSAVVAATTDTAVLDEFKENDAYLYSGLAFSGNLTYLGKLDPDLEIDYGIQTVTWSENKSGSSYFKISRTGILALLAGSESVRLDDSGVYMTDTSAGELMKEALTLPNPLKVGVKWPTDMVLKQPGQTVTTIMTSEVTKIETITVEAGEFECLVIVSTSSLTSTIDPSSVATLKIVSHYAKEYGVIKIAGTGKNLEGEEIDMYLELAKIGD